MEDLSKAHSREHSYTVKRASCASTRQRHLSPPLRGDTYLKPYNEELSHFRQNAILHQLGMQELSVIENHVLAKLSLPLMHSNLMIETEHQDRRSIFTMTFTITTPPYQQQPIYYR